MVILALDATYSVGNELSGVGVYSREILDGLAAGHPEARFHHLYRSHKLLKSRRGARNVIRGLLTESWRVPFGERLFHGLNQRMPRIRFRRSVCTFHDLFVMTGQYSSPEFRERFTCQAREAVARADLIVTVSEFTARQAHELLGVERNRLRVVHHGVRKLPVPAAERKPVVLTVGAIQHRKNITRLVEAFEALPEPWRLVVAGAASGYGSESIIARIQASKAAARIEVTGYVSASELARLYATASLFAFPSLDEGFGMPALEAMGAGVPVIASKRSALPEVCGDAAVLVDPFQTDEIAGALQTLAADEDAREHLRGLGRMRAAQFTWDAAVEQTWSVYQELLR